MNIRILDLVDVDYLDSILTKPVPHSQLKNVPIEHIQLWCVTRGYYQIVTEELVSFLSNLIDGKQAIEICAGHGLLGRSLGIPSTDSYVQTRPEIKACYLSLSQAPIEPPPDVFKMEAIEAVNYFKPDLVIGSWVTQKWIGGSKGSVWGVDEEAIFEKASYIHIGNDHVHGWKCLMRRNHQHLRFPWLVSRANDQYLNHLAVWSR